MAAFAKTRPSANPSSSVPTGPQFDNRRMAAGLIDLLVPLGITAGATLAGLSLTVGVLMVAVGWTLYYFFALESAGGQTLGKRVMKLRVVAADGSPASMEQIAKRTIVRIVDGHIVGLIVMLATGERRQRLGDIVAGTVITEAGAAPAEAGERSPEAPAQEAAPAVAAPAVAAPAEKPRKRRGLKELSKLEIGRRSKRDELPADAVMAAAPYAATPLPADRLPESLRPEPIPEVRPFDPLSERPVPEPEPAEVPTIGIVPQPEEEPEPVVEIEQEHFGDLEPEPQAVIEHEPVATEPVVEERVVVGVEPFVAPGPEPAAEPEIFADAEPAIDTEPVPEHEPSVEIRPPGLPYEPEPSPYAHLQAESSPYGDLSPEPSPYASAEGDRADEAFTDAEPVPAVVESEPSLYGHMAQEPEPEVELQREPVVELDSGPRVDIEPEPSLYGHLESEPEPSLYGHLQPEPEQQPEPASPAGRYTETEVAGAPETTVKPIETVSAIDLLMQEVEARKGDSSDPNGSKPGAL